MVANAVERQSAPHTNWLRLLAPNSERLEFATRIALICALTSLATQIYQTPEPALTAYIALIFLLANLVVDDAMWRVISIAVISFALLFLGSASRLRPIASILALIAGYALALLGTIQTGELATRGLLYLLLDFGIVAGLTLLVNMLFAPAPRHVAERAIADRLQLSAAVLRDAEDPARGELSAEVRNGVAPILKQVRFAGLERSAPAPELAALQQAALSSFALMSSFFDDAATTEIEVPSAV